GAGAHRRVEEHQRDRLSAQLVTELFALERGRLRQQRVEVGARPVLGVEEVPGGRSHRGGSVRKEGTPGGKTKSPARRLGFRVSRHDDVRASGYPAWWKGRRRRAREVMPAAIHAEVTMSASARKWVIGRECSHAARPSATGTSRGTPRCGCKGGSQAAGPGHDGGDPDADAQAVARIVGQARPVRSEE